jgi:hypothetical protein
LLATQLINHDGANMQYYYLNILTSPIGSAASGQQPEN